MKNEIIQRIYGVLNALNNISVKGKANLSNLSGSIAVLEEMAAILENADAAAPAAKENE